LEERRTYVHDSLLHEDTIGLVSKKRVKRGKRKRN
jgi:hypothetical protein